MMEGQPIKFRMLELFNEKDWWLQDIVPKLTMYQASMIEFVGQQGNESNPWLSSVKYNHVSVVSAIRMRQPELARQSMADHIRTSLNFTSLSGERADPFHPFRKAER